MSETFHTNGSDKQRNCILHCECSTDRSKMRYKTMPASFCNYIITLLAAEGVTADCLQTVNSLAIFSSHNAKTQFVLTLKFRMVTTRKYLKRNKTDCIIYRHLNSLNHCNVNICVSLDIHVIAIGYETCDVVHCCRHLLSLAAKNCTFTVGIKKLTWKYKICTKFYSCTVSRVTLTANINVLIKHK